jgi:hypothetical protein
MAMLDQRACLMAFLVLMPALLQQVESSAWKAMPPGLVAV